MSVNVDRTGMRNTFIKHSIFFWIGFPMFFLALTNSFHIPEIFVYLGWGIMGLPKIFKVFTSGFGAALASPLAQYEEVEVDINTGRVVKTDGGTGADTMNLAVQIMIAVFVFAIGGLLALIHIFVMTIQCLSKNIAMPIIAANFFVVIGGIIATVVLSVAIGIKSDTDRGVQKVKGYNYVLNRAGNGVIIDAYTGKKQREIVFPAEINGLPVVGIDLLFTDITAEYITSVKIPDTVTHIENFLYNCINVKEITLPKNLRTVGKNVFKNSGLTSIVIPEGVTLIGDYAFSYCKALTSVVLPKSLERVGIVAFGGCSSLVDVQIPEGAMVTYKKEGNIEPFHNCSSLSSTSKQAIINSGFKGKF